MHPKRSLPLSSCATSQKHEVDAFATLSPSGQKEDPTESNASKKKKPARRKKSSKREKSTKRKYSSKRKTLTKEDTTIGRPDMRTNATKRKKPSLECIFKLAKESFVIVDGRVKCNKVVPQQKRTAGQWHYGCRRSRGLCKKWSSPSGRLKECQAPIVRTTGLNGQNGRRTGRTLHPPKLRTAGSGRWWTFWWTLKNHGAIIKYA